MSESEKERPFDKHADPAPPVEVPDAVRERVRVQASPVRCPFCHDDVRVGEQNWVACAGCLARHHAGCWGEAGRCGACGDAASLEGGGASRARTIVAIVVATVFVLLVLVGLALVMRSVEGLREAVRAQRVAPVEAPAAPPAPAPPPPYLGETPAVAAMRVAAHGGDVAAAHDLAAALAEGKGVAPNAAEALRWFERAADQGDPRAMRALADSHRFGNLQPDGKTDHAQAVFWYRRAVEVDYDQATAVKLTTLLGSTLESLAWAERLAREGHVDSMIRAHQFTVQHHGEARAKEAGWVGRAIEALRERVEGGDKAAAERLFMLLGEGRYQVEHQDGYGWVKTRDFRPEQAVEVLERLAAAGSIGAMERLETAHRQGGFGLPRDSARALQWTRRQAELGSTNAMLRCAENGDQAEAARWYRRALADTALEADIQVAVRRELSRVLENRPDLRMPGDP